MFLFPCFYFLIYKTVKQQKLQTFPKNTLPLQTDIDTGNKTIYMTVYFQPVFEKKSNDNFVTESPMWNLV